MSGSEFRNAILRENLLFHKGMRFHPLHVTGSQSAQSARPEDFADDSDGMNSADSVNGSDSADSTSGANDAHGSNNANNANRAQGGEQ